MNKRKILKIIMLSIVSLILLMGCSNKKEAKKSIENIDTLIVSAQKYFESKDYNNSIYTYKKALAKLPKDIDIRINLSNIYFNIQQYSKSEEFLISALKLNSDRLDIYDKLVKTYNKMGYDSSYILESCNKNNIHISDKTKEKLTNKFNILGIENKTRENNINESFNHGLLNRIYYLSQDSNIRSTPNYYEDGRNILTSAKKGEKIIELNPQWTYEQDSLTGRDRCWINIKLSNGKIGWISKRALDMTNR